MTYRFDPSQGLVVVPVRLLGPAGDMILRLALDTGATSTLINSEILVLLGYDPTAAPDRIIASRRVAGPGFLSRLPDRHRF
jgi:hypothetical protein